MLVIDITMGTNIRKTPREWDFHGKISQRRNGEYILAIYMG